MRYIVLIAVAVIMFWFLLLLICAMWPKDSSIPKKYQYCRLIWIFKDCSNKQQTYCYMCEQLWYKRLALYLLWTFQDCFLFIWCKNYLLYMFQHNKYYGYVLEYQLSNIYQHISYAFVLAFLLKNIKINNIFMAFFLIVIDIVIHFIIKYKQFSYERSYILVLIITMVLLVLTTILILLNAIHLDVNSLPIAAELFVILLLICYIVIIFS